MSSLLYRKVIVVADLINSYSRIEFAYDPPVAVPFTMGTMTDLVDSKGVSKGSLQIINTPLFNDSKLMRLIEELNQNEGLFLQIRKGYALKDISVSPDDISVDLYIGENNSLIYQFYNPTTSRSVQIHAALSTDSDNTAADIQKNLSDIALRQYYVRRAFLKYNNLTLQKPAKTYPSLMNTKEAAEFLGIAEKTLRNWNVTGEIPSRKVGRLVKYRKADLEEYLNRKRK